MDMKTKKIAAAVTAVQLGISRDRAIELFSEFYGDFNGKERSIS